MNRDQPVPSALFVPVNFPPVANFYVHDQHFAVQDFVDNSVVPLAGPIALLPREFFATRTARIVSQFVDSHEDTPDIVVWDTAEVLGDRSLEVNLKFCHAP